MCLHLFHIHNVTRIVHAAFSRTLTFRYIKNSEKIEHKNDSF